MKKYFLLLFICLTSLCIVAQRPSNQRPPQGPPPTEHRDSHHHDSHHPDKHHHDKHHDKHHDGRHQQTPPPPPVQIATEDQLQWALRILETQSFDEKRLEIAKLCVVLCPFTVRDLGRMAETFAMESNKLDFLKFAYRYCPDPENYPRLRDVLRFRSDFDTLMDTVDPTYRRPF